MVLCVCMSMHRSTYSQEYTLNWCSLRLLQNTYCFSRPYNAYNSKESNHWSQLEHKSGEIKCSSLKKRLTENHLVKLFYLLNINAVIYRSCDFNFEEYPVSFDKVSVFITIFLVVLGKPVKVTWHWFQLEKLIPVIRWDELNSQFIVTKISILHAGGRAVIIQISTE